MPIPKGVRIRDITNVDEHKKWIDQSIMSAFDGLEHRGKKVTLKVSNPQILDREYTLDDQKKALMQSKSLSKPVKADIAIIDNETGQVLSKDKNRLIAHAPYHTGRNSVISNGVYYTIGNQMRLRPGAYTREKANKEIETHFNTISGTGSGFRIGLDPNKGTFGFTLGTTHVKLYPLLRAMGATDEQLKGVWGAEQLNINKMNSSGEKDIAKLYERLLPFGDKNLSTEQKAELVVDKLQRARMEPEINQVTLGRPHANVTSDAILDATKKILNVSRGKESEDDRDSLQFKKIYSVEDFYKEKVRKDAGAIGRTLVRRLDRDPSVDKVPTGVFTRQLWGTIKGDPKVSPMGALAQPIEEINPIDMYDQHHKVTIMGEGGIGDPNVVTLEARNVHPSQFGFIDHIRTPESENVGIDQRLAMGVRKGTDNKIYKEFTNAKTGKKEWFDPLEVITKVVAFPKEWQSKKKTLQVMNKGELAEVPRSKVEYYLEHPNEIYSTYSNMIPFPEAIQGNRMIMGAKAMATSMPIVGGDAPLVRSQNPLTGNSFEYDIGRKIMAKEARVSGKVTKVEKGNIFIKDGKGKIHRHGIYNNYPLNLKTRLHNTPLVKVGDQVKKGDLLAKSNFTDDEGVINSGKNLLSAYMPYKGYNFEDGIIISEDAAKKLTSEQMYTHEYKIDNPANQKVSKKSFSSVFPTIFSKEQIDKLDDSGVIKPGMIVKPGDPLIAALEKKPPSSRDIQLGNLHKSLKNLQRDASTTWNHITDGVVTDVYTDNKRVKVLVKTNTPAQVGDKLTGRFGNKGVISLVLPNEKMPQIKESGEKVDIMLNPVGIPSRINPAQLHEAMLGKVAKKRGKPYIVPSFSLDNDYKAVKREMDKYGVKDTDNILLPDDEREISDVATGQSYIWKLSKLSEGELKKREIGGYDIDEQPIKGKSEAGQAIKIGSMEVNALLGHNARHNLREISTIKGQRNPDYWKMLKWGAPLPSPRVPFVYKKFHTMLQGAGINTKKEGTQYKLMPLTDRDILAKSSGKVQNPDLLYSKNLMPIRGGLFDPGITGGTVGSKWAHIELTEELPNPIMEEPIKKILGINQKEYLELLKKNKLKDKIANLNIDDEISKTQDILKSSKKSKRDNALKKLSFLSTLKDNGFSTRDLLLKNVPVIPPVFRPVSVVGTKEVLSPGNANLLYKDLMVTNKALEGLKEEVPDEELSTERQNNYRSLKAVVGLSDPLNVQNKNKRVKGFIADIVGEQPKTGFFQNKMITKTQDLVGRGVAIPDPALNMDQIGIPEDVAWKMYEPAVTRKMSQMGTPSIQAAEEIKNRSFKARQVLDAEMKTTPIIMNRNPSLHKYNIMAFDGIIRKDHVIATSPPVASGFNLDHDGDQVNLHIPVTPEAIREANEVLKPSKNLLHIKNRKVHYLPLQGSILGTYSMTKPPKDRKIKKTFGSMQDLKTAFARGEIKATDLVKVTNAN